MKHVLTILLAAWLASSARSEDQTSESARGAQNADPIVSLKNRDPGIREKAARDIGWQGRPGNRAEIDALLIALADDHNAVRLEAAKAVGLLDVRGESVPRLRNLLAAERPEVRRAAAQALGRIGAPATGAVPQLIEMLSQAEVAEEAAGALARLDGTGRSVPALIDLIKGPPSKGREAAIDALGQLAPLAAAALPPLIKLLKEPDPSETAISALGNFYGKASQAVPALRLLKTKADPGSSLAILIDNVLPKIEHADQFPQPVKPPQLKDQPKASPDPRGEKYRKTRTATVAGLIAMFQDQDAELRAIAAWELSRRGSPGVEPLERAFKTGDNRTRSLAGVALGKGRFRPEGDEPDYLIVIPQTPSHEIAADKAGRVADQLRAASRAEWRAGTYSDDNYRNSVLIAARLKTALARSMNGSQGELLETANHVASAKLMEAEDVERIKDFVHPDDIFMSLFRGQLFGAEAQRELGKVMGDPAMELAACQQAVLTSDRLWGIARSVYGSTSSYVDTRGIISDAFAAQADARIALMKWTTDPQSRRCLLEPLLLETQIIIPRDEAEAPWFKYNAAKIRAELARREGDRDQEISCRCEGLDQVQGLARSLNDRFDGQDSFRRYLKVSWSREFFQLAAAIDEQSSRLKELRGEPSADPQARIDEFERLTNEARGFVSLNCLGTADYDYIAAHYLLARLRKE